MHTCCRSTWQSVASRSARLIEQGRVWMPPRLQGDFLTLLGRALHRSCVRPLVWLADATGRYAVRTIRATSVQRAWFALAPGLVSRTVNIEVLAA